MAGRRQSRRHEDNTMHLSDPKIEFHRNGCFGAGFHLVTFSHRESPRGRRSAMLATVFETPGHVAVVNVEMAAQGEVRFGVNSWRGDEFEPWLRDQIRVWADARAADQRAAAA
jgi:hypothetical protein